MKNTVFFSIITALILCLGFTLNLSTQAATLAEHNVAIGDDDSNTNNLPYGDTDRMNNTENNTPNGPRRTMPNGPENPRNIDNRYYNSNMNNNGVNYTRTAATNDNNDTDYGWIGLAGLLGLLGMMRGGRKS